MISLTKPIKSACSPSPVCIVSYIIYSSSGFHHPHPVVGQAQAHVCAHLQHTGQIGRHDEDRTQFGVKVVLVIAAQISRLRRPRGQTCAGRANVPGLGPRSGPRLTVPLASACAGSSMASPMKPATNSLLGYSYKSCAVPHWAITPWSITMIWWYAHKPCRSCCTTRPAPNR